MKNIKHILFPLLALLAGFQAWAAISEPVASKLASGKWVKIRVETDGMYQLTTSELKNLGFTNPEKVNVYGYNPTLLFSHDFNKMPVDLSPLPSVYEGGKLVFYGKANTDLEPEIWHYEKFKASANQTEEDYPTAAQFEHMRHVFSRGATYFLSDCDEKRVDPSVISPSAVSTATPAQTHKAILYDEEDINHYGQGGVIFVGKSIDDASASVSYPFTLSKVAGKGEARLLYQGLDGYGGKKCPLLASFSGGIKSQPSEGAAVSIVATSATHQLVCLYRRFQELIVPTESEKRDYTLTFSVNPEFTAFKKSAVDYWMLVYERMNDLTGESQMTMCFDSDYIAAGKSFAVNNHEKPGAVWRFWDVTTPLNPRECQMRDSKDGTLVGEFATAPGNFAASYVVAFDLNSRLMSPEIVGQVANQNLHSMNAPDVVILTSAMLTEVAEELADLHRGLQGLDVEVIDQELIFNEYSSGNTSPEAVRRFLAHLDRKNPDKLKALIIVGTPVVDNARNINSASPSVVTAQNECQDDDTYEVRSFYSDSFFGRFGNPVTTGNWGVRHQFYQIHANEMNIAVGRIPLSSPSEIRNYINKVRQYITEPPHSPAPSTVIIASDYEGTPGAAMHYADAEAVSRPLADRFDAELTRVRPAANFLSTTNFDKGRQLLLSAFSQGANLMLYFGHGRPDAFGSVKGKFLMDMSSAETCASNGFYPFAFIGSCNVARCDVNPSNISVNMLKNKTGGLIGLVASTREVFQQENTVLGLQFVKEYDAAADGDYWGNVYKRAQSKAVDAAATNRRTMLNHLCYTYVGDPLIPVYKAERKIVIDKVNDDNQSLFAAGANRVEGAVLDKDGKTDTGFAGTVVLNVYDMPSERKNLISQGSTSDAEYLPKIVEDHTVLKQVVGQVKNGRFALDFNGPYPTVFGEHRLLAYAYSNDKSVRASGYIKGIQSSVDPERPALAGKGDIKIRYIGADNAGFDSQAAGPLVIEAEIHAPNGLSSQGILRTPLRFVMDGRNRPDAAKLLNYMGNDTYRMIYPTGALAVGRHTVELTVIDDCGTEDYCEFEFSVGSSAFIELTAEVVAPGSVKVDCSLTADAETRIIVETLDGTLVKELKTRSLPATVSGLTPGVYRVYTQHEGDRFRASSPKSVVIID